MATSLERDLKLLQRRKLKAQEKSDLTEEAKLCNAAGELLAQHGYFEKAVKEHKQEVQLSEAIQDKVGAAIAHRKVGECLCGLGKYKDALFHQNLHLQLAKSAKNLVEEQRALATIGRTWFLHSEGTTEPDEVEESLLEAQAAYLKSLSVCDKLRDSVPEKELLEMRSRLYLNLGLIYDSRDDQVRSCRFMEKALFIARDQALKETEYKCLYSLGAITTKAGQIACALRYFEEALQVARKSNKKFDEADALEQLGQVLLRLGEFSAGKRALKGAYKISKARLSDDISCLKSNLISAIKGIKLQRKHKHLSDLPTEEQIKLLENLGDLYCKVKAFHKALDCYKAELKLAKSMEKPPKVLSSICVSLAMTYSDLKCPEDAIKCYMEELELMDGNYIELCDTWCNVANVHENAKHEYDRIEEAYLKALEYAVLAASPSAQLRVHRCLADTQKIFGLTEKYVQSRNHVKSLEEEVGIEDEEEENESEIIDETEEIDEVLLESELHSPDSDEEDNDDDDQTTGSSIRRQPRSTRKAINKVNEKGETPLHRAAIAGDVQLTKELLEKGACVNARDYCGWQPIHEASNHGHTGIVAVLINMGADVNDAGGSHCRGITPLHDAAINGHAEVVKLLVSRGAAVNQRNSDGETALDAVSKAIRNDEQEKGEDTEVEIGRKKVGQFLRQAAKTTKFGPQQQQHPEMRRRMRMQDEEDSDCNDSEEERSKVLGIGRESTEEEDNADENSEEFLPRKRTNHIMIHEEDSQASELGNVDITPMDVDHIIEGAASASCSSSYESACRLPNPFYSAHSLSDDVGEQLSGDNDSTYASMDEDVVEILHTSDVDSDFDTTAGVGPSDSRLNPTSTHKPALLSEAARNTGNSDSNWLIDDLAPRKRRRQSKVTSTFQRSGTAGSGTRGKRSLSSGGLGTRAPRTHSRSSVSTSRPRQTRLDVTREVTTTRSDASSSIATHEEPFRHSLVDASVPDSDLIVSLSTLSGRTAPGSSLSTAPVRGPSLSGTTPIHGPSARGPTPAPPMRVRVKVQGKSFLIPCPTSQSGEARTIGWLADQASLRYFSSSGLRPILALQTGEGASLSSEDKITDLLSTNEEVIGFVESWDLPPLAERYRTACSNAGSAVRDDILQLFNTEPQLSTLSLPNKALRPAHALPLFRALQCHDRLVKLLLPGNRLGDTGLQHLASAITSLPSLALLNVQANAITATGLSYITDVLASRQTTSNATNEASGALRKLEELNVAFNPLGNTVGTSLAVLLRNCPHLVTLNLDSCSLTSEIFQRRKEFAEALKGSCLQHLTVAHNSFGTSGVPKLLSALPVASLLHLDLTSVFTQHGHGNEQTAVRSLLNFFDQDGCCVRTLTLADCHLRDSDMELLIKARRLTHGLHTLDLSCNQIGEESVPTLSQLLSNSKSLTVLNLAGNGKLRNKAMEVLNQLTGCTVQTLNLSACAIKSPLEDQTVHAIRNLSCNSTGANTLSELDLSHNFLSFEDKQQLADDWDVYREGKSTSRLESPLCVLCTPSS